MLPGIHSVGAAAADPDVAADPDKRLIYIGIPRNGQEGIHVRVRPGGGAQHITIDDTFQAWAEQENLGAKDRFFAMIMARWK